MKLSKKLLPAILMLVVSAIMLTTSSFAWFSMNTNVSATDMTVTAKADQVFLQISDGSKVYDANGDEGTTNMFSDKVSMVTVAASNTGASKTFLPVAVGTAATDPVFVDGVLDTEGSVTDLGTTEAASRKWFSNFSKTTESYAPAGAYEEIPTNDNEAILSTNYALINTFYLRLNPSAGRTTAAQPLTSTVALVTSTDEALAQSVSVLIVCGDYAQVWKQTALNVWALDGGDKQLTAGAFTNSGSNEGAVEVKVYVFFDGENANCTTANIKTTGYEVQVNFDVATPVA